MYIIVTEIAYESNSHLTCTLYGADLFLLFSFFKCSQYEELKMGISLL